MVVAATTTIVDNVEFDAFVEGINARFNALTKPAFVTTAEGLYDAYLAAFPAGPERQYHTCSCCKAFIETYGHLATVNDDGSLESALWDPETAPSHYREAVTAMAVLVQQANLQMPFLSAKPMYGTPVTGMWHHYAVKPVRIFKETPVLSAWQAACAKREELPSVTQALLEYGPTVVDAAVRVLESDTLSNSAAVIGQAKFLQELHNIKTVKRVRNSRHNQIYAKVAAAPAGFCHPRTSMIATLLDDLVAGKTFEQAKAAWAKKMHPLQYQRPQALPSAGNVKAAQDAFEKLGAATALERRFAIMDDIQEKLWSPRAAPLKVGTLFADIATKKGAPAAPGMALPTVKITLDKFCRTVLPTAERMEVLVPRGLAHFTQLTTAVHADAAPIMQWDSLERRNPVCWYLYNGGQEASQFGLTGGAYTEVLALVRGPSEWLDGQFDHQGKRVLFVLQGCTDQRSTGTGSALFPQCLKSEYRPYSSVIEQYSRTHDLQKIAGGAAGLPVSKESADITVRVTVNGQTAMYHIDRWD